MGAVTYTYHNANRPTQISQSSSTTSLDYDNANRRTLLTRPNNVVWGISLANKQNSYREYTSWAPRNADSIRRLGLIYGSTCRTNPVSFLIGTKKNSQEVSGYRLKMPISLPPPPWRHQVFSPYCRSPIPFGLPRSGMPDDPLPK